MNNETFDELAHRLREDAERIRNRRTPLSAPDLMARYRRRLLGRRIIGGSVAVLVAMAVIVLPQLGFVDLDSPVVDERQLDKPLESLAQSPRYPVPHDARVKVQTRPPGSGSSSLAVPLLLVSQTADGTEVIMPALFVPPRAEPVDLKRLSPIERRAIREVLEIDEPPSSRNSI